MATAWSFFEEELPLLSVSAVVAATGNPDARPETLRLKCEEFLARLRKGRGQLRHHVKALPLPTTHCTVCWRACDAAHLDFAELAYEQTRPSSGLQRISGGVFSRLCGHRPPYCCDAAWHCADVLETFARYDAAREVHEAPVNPGCSPDYSFVGGSLRLLPTARLDRLTEAWQTKYGYDAKPFYEMRQACANLRGVVVALPPRKCGLGFCSRVSVQAEICDFSRSFSSDGDDVACVMGRISVHFHGGHQREGPSGTTLTLPSRRMVLAVAPTCRKGGVPLVKGTAAYVKRREEKRPNVAHVVGNAKGDLECSILCQNELGERRLFFAEGRFKARESAAEEGCEATGVEKTELHFFVRAPHQATTGEAERVEKLKRSVAGKGKKRKEDAQLVLLMPWLQWLLGGYEEDRAREELKRWTRMALGEELGCEPPELYVEAVVDAQATGPRPYAPRSENVTPGSFLTHVPDEPHCKLEALSKLLAKALAVHLLRRSADSLPSTKSMNSASDVWQGLLRKAVQKALSEALKKSLGSVERKQLGAGKTKLEKVYHEYDGRFDLPEACLLDKCYNRAPAPRAAVVVLDAFAEHHCSKAPLESAFHILQESACGRYDDDVRCPMCQTDYEPRHNLFLADPNHSACHLCGFKKQVSDQGLHAWRVETTRKVVKASSRKDVRLQKLFFSLDVAKHLALDGVALRHLCKALKGQDEAKDRPQVGAVVAPGTENSAKGTNGRRGENVPTELHENLVDGRAGKDSNPDLRVYLLTGSSVQRRPSAQELRTLLECVRAAWGRREGCGRLEVRGRTLLTFEAHEAVAVMAEVRRAVHRAAELCGEAELATCCPVLSYGCGGPVVTLLCSGSELVRAAGWRALTERETSALEALAVGRAFALDGLHESWKDLAEKGLTWEMLVFAGVVAYCAEERHVVLKEDAADAGAAGDGLTFYKISAELESSMRVLQTEDAATWQAGHAIRQGYSVGMALNAHKFEPLAHGKGSISSIRSVGFDPCRGNMRNLVGSAPDNHYGGTLKLMALLHDFGTVMQEDSMPECADAFRHLTLRSQSVCFTARTHWTLSRPANGHKIPLGNFVRGKCHRKDVGACLEDESGLVEKPYAFVKSGQALCFVIGGAEPEEKGGEPEPLLHKAHRDMWVKAIKVGAPV
jgi:hypothetical protein